MIIPTLHVNIAPQALNVTLGNPVVKEYTGGEPYEGEYTVTPTQETQVLQTSQKVLAHNVTINPIPSNYGLITWTGSVLTVT